MKKIELSKLDVSVYTETLDNGLEIYLVPFEDKNRYFITYATKYGSTTTEFMPYGFKKYEKVPNGVAHFLEHKMFEQENGENPFEFFSKSGSYVNASTGFENTRYICSGTTNYEENLKYLINFVNTPYFTEQNVEKEKGIIIEELNMYKDDPESVLDDLSRKSVFNQDNHRIDIGGEVEDVVSIKKEDLYLCYENFYSPKNMFILIVGNIDVYRTLDILKDSFKTRENKYKELPKVKEVSEQYKVFKKREVKYFNVEVPKVSYNLKLKIKDLGIEDEFILDNYLNIILKSLFGSTSLFNEKALQEELFANYYFDFDFIGEYVVINLVFESKKINELLEFVDETLKNRKKILNQDEFSRAIKVSISNRIKATCYIDSVVSSLYSDLINYNKIIDNKIDVLRKLKYDEMIKVSDSIDISNNSIVCLVPKDYKDFKINI
ncbi:MAG: insulinase family protein [Bacilli bacterium]|nr:insulinase family protein [Bacilli bacterium]